MNLWFRFSVIFCVYLPFSSFTSFACCFVLGITLKFTMVLNSLLVSIHRCAWEKKNCVASHIHTYTHSHTTTITATTATANYPRKVVEQSFAFQRSTNSFLHVKSSPDISVKLFIQLPFDRHKVLASTNNKNTWHANLNDPTTIQKRKEKKLRKCRAGKKQCADKYILQQFTWIESARAREREMDRGGDEDGFDGCQKR